VNEVDDEIEDQEQSTIGSILNLIEAECTERQKQSIMPRLAWLLDNPNTKLILLLNAKNAKKATLPDIIRRR